MIDIKLLFGHSISFQLIIYTKEGRQFLFPTIMSIIIGFYGTISENNHNQFSQQQQNIEKKLSLRLVCHAVNDNDGKSFKIDFCLDSNWYYYICSFQSTGYQNITVCQTNWTTIIFVSAFSFFVSLMNLSAKMGTNICGTLIRTRNQSIKVNGQLLIATW